MWTWRLIVLILGFPFSVVDGQDSPGHLDISRRSSGVHCAGTQCVKDATCWNNETCNCPSETYGEGNLKCYPSNSQRAQVDGGSNTLTSFTHLTANILWPGSYGLTDFTCTRRSNGRHCRVQVIGISTIRKGRILVYGFRINIRCLDDPHLSVNGVCLMVTGVNKGGTYYYHDWGIADCGPEDLNNAPNPDQYPDLTLDGSGSGDGEEGSTGGSSGGSGSSSGGGSSGGTNPDDEKYFTQDEEGWDDPVDLDLGGGHVVTISFDKDNTAVVSVQDCSFEVGFRAHNLYEASVDRTSVIYVYHSDDVEFYQPNQYFAGLSDDIHTQLEGENYLLHLALTFATRQVSDPLGRLCASTAKVYQTNCNSDSSKNLAITTCSHLLSEAVVGCLDSDSDNYPGTKSAFAFQLCIKISCNPSQTLCSRFQSFIPSSCWHKVEGVITSLNCS